MNNKQVLRGFKLTYLSATDKLPARVKIIDTRFKKSVVINRDTFYHYWIDQAIQYMEKVKGIKIYAVVGDFDMILTKDFNIQIK